MSSAVPATSGLASSAQLVECEVHRLARILRLRNQPDQPAVVEGQAAQRVQHAPETVWAGLQIKEQVVIEDQGGAAGQDTLDHTHRVVEQPGVAVRLDPSGRQIETGGVQHVAGVRLARANVSDAAAGQCHIRLQDFPRVDVHHARAANQPVRRRTAARDGDQMLAVGHSSDCRIVSRDSLAAKKFALVAGLAGARQARMDELNSKSRSSRRMSATARTTQP